MTLKYSRKLLAGVLALVLVAGTISTATLVSAAPPENNPGTPFEAILDAIAALQLSVDDSETDLLSTKSFYQVEDTVTFTFDTIATGHRHDVLVSLSCPGSVPVEMQAFNIETLGVQVSHINDDNQVAFFNSTVIDQSYGFFYGEAVSEFIGSNLVTNNQFDHDDGSAVTIGASEEVRFTGNIVNLSDGEGIILKAVAIGEKPLGCDVTIDADAEWLGLPLPGSIPNGD